MAGSMLDRAPRALVAAMTPRELAAASGAAARWREQEDRIRVERASLVADLRGRGCSWDSIGWLLGVTGEAVRIRYGEQAAS